MFSWIQGNEELIWRAAALSGVTFVATLLFVPLILIRLPVDYFSHRRRSEMRARARHPIVRALLALLKNILGVAFIIVGVAMLMLPGQGILTIVVGLMLLNFPGKYRAERWAVGHASVLRGINWIRARADKPPMMVDFDDIGHVRDQGHL
jgi:archaellum biogenesis protein FlaJ (TadC family)